MSDWPSAARGGFAAGYAGARVTEPSALEKLQEAAAKGSAAVVSLAKEVGDAEIAELLPHAPDAFWLLVEAVWPDGFGRSASILAGEGAAVSFASQGLPLDVEVAGTGGVEGTIGRRNTTLEFGVAALEEIGVEAAPRLKKVVAVPLGMDFESLVSVKCLLELAPVVASPALTRALVAGDPGHAMTVIVRESKDELQWELQRDASVLADVGSETGSDSKGKFLMVGGLKAGLGMTYRTENSSKPGFVELRGDIGSCGGIEWDRPGVRYDGGAPGLVDKLTRVIAKRQSEVASGEGKTGLGVTGRIRVTIPPRDGDQAWGLEIAIGAEYFADLDATLGGAGGSGSGEVVLGLADVEGAIAALENGDGGAILDDLLANSGINAQLQGTVSVKALRKDIGMFDAVFPDAEQFDELHASVTFDFSAGQEKVQRFIAAADGWMEPVRHLVTGDWQGAQAAFAQVKDGPSGLKSFLDSFTVRVEAANVSDGTLQTPYAGDVMVGGEVSYEARLTEFQEMTFDPANLGLTDFWNVFSALI